VPGDSICREIPRYFENRTPAPSDPRQGSTAVLWTTFVVSYRMAFHQQKPASGEIPMAPSPPRRKLLVTKDEPSIRSVLRVLVAGLHYDGDVASGVQQVLSLIRQNQFDTVLLDLRSTDLRKGTRPSLDSGPS